MAESSSHWKFHWKFPSLAPQLPAAPAVGIGGGGRNRTDLPSARPFVDHIPEGINPNPPLSFLIRQYPNLSVFLSVKKRDFGLWNQTFRQPRHVPQSPPVPPLILDNPPACLAELQARLAPLGRRT